MYDFLIDLGYMIVVLEVELNLGKCSCLWMFELEEMLLNEEVRLVFEKYFWF